MTSEVIIMSGYRHVLRSFGNGWAYELRDTVTHQSIWLQDEDATQFRTELTDLENAHPNWTAEQILSELGDQYDAAFRPLEVRA